MLMGCQISITYLSWFEHIKFGSIFTSFRSMGGHGSDGKIWIPSFGGGGGGGRGNLGFGNKMWEISSLGGKLC